MRIFFIHVLLVGGALCAAAGPPPPNPMSGKSVAQLGKILKSGAPEMDRVNAVLALRAMVSPPEVSKGKRGRNSKAPEWTLKIPAGFIHACAAGLEDGACAVRFYSGQAMALAGAEALPALIKAVGAEHDDCSISALHAMGMMAKRMGRSKSKTGEVDLAPVFGPAVPVLRQALKRSNYIVREAACAAFARLGAAGSPAIDDLIALLADGHFCVVNQAVHAVAAADPGGAKSVPALVKALASEHDVREFIVKELGNMGRAAKGAVPGLCKLVGLDKNSWHVALESARALLRIVTYDEKPAQDAVAAERKQALSAIATALLNQDAQFLQARIRNAVFDNKGYCPIGKGGEPLKESFERMMREHARAEPGHTGPPRPKVSGVPDPAVPEQEQAPGKKPVKLYIIAGQSNAEQKGSMAWMRDTWPEYSRVDPKLWHFDPGKKPPSPFNGETYLKHGVELVPGIEISKRVDNDVIFLATAIGGTTLRQKWTSPTGARRLDCEVGDLYIRMLQRTFGLIRNLDSVYPRYRGQGVEIAGMIWFQGENDSLNLGHFPFYQDLFMDFINDVRRDLGVPDLPIFICKINDAWCERIGGGEVIRRANENAMQKLDNVEAVHTHDLHEKAHYDSTPSYIVIGRRLADIMLPYCGKPVHADMDGVKAAMQRFLGDRRVVAGQQDMTGLRKGLVDYWKFDRLSAPSAVNGTESWLGTDEKYEGPVLMAGKFGKSIKLHGSQSITFPGYRDEVGKDGRIEQISVQFWARNFGGGGNYRIGKGEGRPLNPAIRAEREKLHHWFIGTESNRRGWDIRGCSGGSLSLTASVMKGDVQRAFSIYNTTGFSGDGVNWVHVVVVIDAAGGVVRYYRNGIAVRNHKRSTDPRYPNKHAAKMAGELGCPLQPILAAADAKLMISGPMSATTEFQAYDELAIWSRALSEGEVRKLYNGGAGSEIPVE